MLEHDGKQYRSVERTDRHITISIGGIITIILCNISFGSDSKKTPIVVEGGSKNGALIGGTLECFFDIF